MEIRPNWFKVIFIVDNPYTHPYKMGEIYWGFYFNDCYYLCMTLEGKRIDSHGYKKTQLIPLVEWREQQIDKILND